MEVDLELTQHRHWSLHQQAQRGRFARSRSHTVFPLSQSKAEAMHSTRGGRHVVLWMLHGTKWHLSPLMCKAPWGGECPTSGAWEEPPKAEILIKTMALVN